VRELGLAVPAMVMELNGFDVATVTRLSMLSAEESWAFPTFRTIYLGASECLYATRRVLLGLFDYGCNQHD
jgi:hypothetical protein